MRPRLVVALLALAAAAPASAGVEVRSVDGSGFPLVRLTVVASEPTPSRPRLREAGVPVAGAVVTNLARGKSVVLAIDRSRSMTGAPLEESLAAARLYIARKNRDDRLALVAFGSGAAELVPFTASSRDLLDGLAALGVDAERGTALHDGLVSSVRLLAGERGGGRVVILLTDGRDVSSSASLGEAIAAARREGVLVYTVGLRGTDFAPHPLRRIAAATGGRYATATVAALPAIYGRLASELQRTWRVEYPTSARPGTRVRVSVEIPGRGTATARLTLPGQRSRRGESGARFAQGTVGDVALALVVGGLALLAAQRVASYRRASRLRRRLRVRIVSPDAGGEARSSLRERLTGAAYRLFGATERAFGERRRWAELERAIERAGLPLRAVELAYASLGAAVLVGLLLAVLAAPALAVLLGFTLAGLAPLVFVRLKGRRRAAAFEDQLPDLLMTLASALKSGRSFRAGLQTAAEEAREPAGGELKLALAEARLGRPLEDALAEMAIRLDSENFRYVVNAVAIQREVGGSLATLFDMVADTVRTRQQFGRKLRALTAMGRMSAYVMIGLPFALALGLTALNAEYMAPLWSTGAGRAMVVFSLVMIGIGWTVIRRIVAFGG